MIQEFVSICSNLPSAAKCFFDAYQHVFEGIGAIATVAAVWIALHQNKPKIKADFSINYFSGNNSSIEGVVVWITNKGNMPVFVPNGFFALRFPFGGLNNGYRQFITNPYLPEASIFSFKLEPRKSKSFEIEHTENFVYELRQIKNQVGKFRFYFVRGIITLEDGSVFRVNNVNNIIKSLMTKA